MADHVSRPSSFYKKPTPKQDASAPLISLSAPIILHVRPEWLAAWTAIKDRVLIPRTKDGKGLYLEGCWLWEPIAVRGQSETIRWSSDHPSMSIQRLMYLIFRGDIQGNAQVRRACSHRRQKCINPNHLRIPARPSLVPEEFARAMYAPGGKTGEYDGA